ncbi:MAG TPA: tetratricopeptide repeat protein, partial [Vicinamibacterales bacterium]|nr:tetratricopeptide repeat protein [Vicinamibacterales bacterium]
MALAPELQSLVQAAAQAAEAGDFVSAERLLREVASRQESELGPRHPDLANTFNNLGVLCEKAGTPDEAERCYRRAYAIASSALAPDDPFVVTSRNNLREFCEARGRPFELEAPSPVELEAPEVPSPVELKVPSPVELEAPAPVADDEPLAVLPLPIESRDGGGRGGRAFAVMLGGLGLVLLAWYGPWRDSAEPPVGADTSSIAPPAAAPAPTEDAGPPPADVPSTAAPRTTAPAPAPVPVKSSRALESPARTASAPAAIAVVEARLCRSLSRSDWRCVPAESEGGPGPFYFY